jgi:O-antigen/teichoic acid export membrane protein
VQVLSVPILLHRWGATLYGEWILLSAIPTYLAMSDIGFGSVAGNEMAMLVTCGKRDEALNVFQSASLFITSISLVVASILGLGIWLLPLDRWLQIHTLSIHEARIILLFLGFSSLLTLQEGLLHVSFRCVGKYALGTTAKSVVQLGMFSGIVLSVLLGANPIQVAVLISATSGIGTLALWGLLRSQIDWIRYGVRHARLATIRRLLWPSVSFMSFPVSNLLNLQGILIVVGHLFGPIGVTTFSTARTISRSVLQGLQLINASVWPEISAAYGSGSLSLLRKLHRTSCQISIGLCMCITLVVAVFGNRVWSVWTLSKLQTDPILLNILLIQMLLGSLWFTSLVVPAATNNHQEIAKVVLVASAMSLVLSYPLMKVDFLGLRGAAISLVLGDIFIALFVLKTSLRLAEDTLPGFCRSLLEVPALPYRWRS